MIKREIEKGVKRIFNRGVVFMNPEKKLKKLIKKYSLISQFSLKRDTESEMLNIWNEIDSNKKIAIWGAGDHGNELIKLLPVKNKNMIFFVDKSLGGIGEELEGYPIYKPEAVEKYNIDLVIISSFRYRNEIALEIENQFNCEYLEFYNELEKKDIKLETPFYYNHPDYLELYELRRLYEKAELFERKEEYLFELICKYLAIRDFYYADKYIQEYIRKDYSQAEKLEEFNQELKRFLGNIKNKIKKRKKNDITLFLLDSLRSRDVLGEYNGSAPFLSELAERAVTFKNAFSTNIFTYMSLFSMFSGKLPIDDGLYKKEMIEIESSDFLETLQKRGYYLYSYVLGKKIFCNSDKLKQIKTRRRLVRKNERNNATGVFASNLLWQHICDIYNNDENPLFALLHLVGEIHKPHICGFHEDRPVIHKGVEEYGDSYPEQGKRNFIKQYYECVAYVDKQMEYFLDFLPSQMTKVIFGDHGQVVENLFTERYNYFNLFGCPDSRVHVPLIIDSPALESENIEELFSMKNVGNLLLNLLNNNFLKLDNKFTGEYIETQFEPVFNQPLAEDLIEICGTKYVLGFKAVRNDTGKFVLYNSGEEDLYILPEENNNKINEIEYQKELRLLSSYMESKDFPSFEEEKYNKTFELKNEITIEKIKRT